MLKFFLFQHPPVSKLRLTNCEMVMGMYKNLGPWVSGKSP